MTLHKDYYAERPSAYDYLRAKHFTDLLKKSDCLTTAQKYELHVRAVHGDLDGAYRDYEQIMRGVGK